MEEKRCYLTHELMNCLAIVLGECELLQVKDGLEGNERLEIIRERANHMAELIRHCDCSMEYEPPRDGFLKSLVRVARSYVEQ